MVVDMLKGTYRNKNAKKNARLLKKITGCDAVKIRVTKNFHIISELVKSNIPVMGHIDIHLNLIKFRIEGSSNSETKNF